MRIKIHIAAISLALLAGIAIWWQLHSRRAMVQVPQPVVVASENVEVFSNPVPANLVKMITVTSKPVTLPPPTIHLADSSWSAVQTLVNSQIAFEQRLKAIDALPVSLTDDDWEALRKFLATPDAMDGSQMGLAIKNRLMDVLCATDPLPPGLGDLFAKIYKNNKQEVVLRDYAVQHLAAYYEQMGPKPDGTKAQQQAKDILWEAVNDSHNSIGGTALLALNRLSQEFPQGFDQDKIAATALRMAGNPIACELTHITAYQICAQLGNQEALPLVVKAAESGESIPVKLSAISAIGELGGPEQIPLLNNVLDGTQYWLRPAAQKSLDQITSRHNLVTGKNNRISNP
jgi:hypothetical protein